MPSHGYLAYTQGKGVQGGCKPPAFFNANFSDNSDNSDDSDNALYKGRHERSGSPTTVPP